MPLDIEEFIALAEAQYGDAGAHGAMSCDLSDADLAKGFAHCLGIALPHIEEELIAAGEC